MKKKIYLLLFLICFFILCSKFYTAESHTHTNSCYYLCPGADTNCDGIINGDDAINYTIEYSGGVEIKKYTCSICGQLIKVVAMNNGMSSTTLIAHTPDQNTLICDATLTSITANYANQTIYKGNNLDVTATATFSNGKSFKVGCICSGFDKNNLSTQTATLSYTYGGVTKTTNVSANVISSGHVHTNACYSLCPGIDNNHDGVIDYNDCRAVPEYYNPNPYVTVTIIKYYCQKCNALVYQYVSTTNQYMAFPHNLDTSNPTCPAYTVAPTISINNITSGRIFSGSDVIYPQVYVYDNENDNLICNYYIDNNSTASGTMTAAPTRPGKVYSFNTPFNASGLSEGAHTIRVTASDNYAKYIGESKLTFYVDKNAPTINTYGFTNSTNSISLAVTASDSVSGLASNAYRFTIGNVTTDWLTSNTYSLGGLYSNTAYAYKIEVKDAVGNINTNAGTAYTKVETPTVSATPLVGSGVKVVVKDNNPSSTLYKIQVGSQYVNSSGVLSSAESWISLAYDASLGGKTVNISGLAANTAYTVIAYAKNGFSAEIVTGNSASVLTAPGIPSGLAVISNSYNNIQLSWNSVAGAVYYEIYRETVASDGTVTAGKTISNITSLSCADSDVLSNQSYRYKIRCKNQNGIYGGWSASISAKTLPTPPVQVTGVKAETVTSKLNISWDAITGALGYEVNISYNGKVWTNRVIGNTITFDAGLYNCQCDITVKAFNATSGSNAADSTLWINPGALSNKYSAYTNANIPTLASVDTVTNKSALITWNINSNPDSVQYKLGVFNGTTIVKEVQISGVSAGTGKLKYSMTGLSPETNYTFKIKAINSNQKETDWSNGLTIKTLIDEPAIITGLRASAKSDRISLFWNKSDRAATYIVEKNGTVVASNITTTSFEDKNVTSDTEYTYRVMAVNTTGQSAWSASLKKKTLGNLPATPTITTISGTDVSANITWSSVNGATGYDIEVNGNYYNVGMNTFYNDDGLIPGNTYTYRVRTRNIYGKSDWSQPVNYSTKPISPDTPVVTASGSSSQIRISWNVVPSTVSYDVEIDSTVYNGILASEYIYTPNPKNSLEHIIRVRAINAGGISEWSAPITASLSESVVTPIISTPAVPTITSVVTGSAVSIVSWGMVEGATQYQLEADGVIVYTGANARYAHSSTVNHSEYVFRVRAGNSSGYSDWSSPVIAINASSAGTTPENLNYYRISDNETAILWDKVSNINSYKIEINGKVLDGIISDTNTKIATTPGTQYTIRVASILSNNEMDWSDEMVFCTPEGLPDTPKLSSVTAASDSVTISWNEVSNANGYEIDLSGRTLDVHNVMTYTFTGLNSKTSYTVKVRAYNESGAGNWTEGKSIMTNVGMAGVPINISAETVAPVKTVTGSAIQLTWTAVQGAVSYDVSSSNGTVYKCNTNSIVIESLVPGESYAFQVRALNNTQTGAWSSKISYIPGLLMPTNVNIIIENGVARLSWDKVNGANLYEIELNGVVYKTTSNNTINLDYNLFFVQREIRIRACYGTQKSEWSEKKTFNNLLPISTTVTNSEILSVSMPYKNADVSKYKLTLTYNSDELELLDACEITPGLEVTSTYISELNTHIVISQNGKLVSISFIVDDDGSNNWAGIVGSISFRSKINGTANLQYGVTRK